MRTEQEIKMMVREIMEQAKPLQHDNPKAFDKLDDYLLALIWVLNPEEVKTKIPEKLIFTQDQLKLLAAFY